MPWHAVGQGVSKQVQQGCPVYQLCQGAGAVVNYTHQDKTLTAAHFRQGAPAPLCLQSYLAKLEPSPYCLYDIRHPVG